MTVYIVQEVPGRNLVPAAKYGELELLLPAKTNLMLSTGPAAIGLCCAIAASINGRFSVLKWDRQEMTYYPVSFDIRGNATDLGEVYV